MSNKKEPLSVKLSKMILAVTVIVSLGTIFGVMGYLASHSKQKIAPIMNTFVKKEIEVVVSTDKTIYEQGETIKIVVNNGLDKSILYSGWGGRFWNVEYFKDGKWINPAHEENGGFQLTEENVGDTCNIALYERANPEELTSQSNLTTEWNQKICPFTENPYIYKSIARYIESGKYRFVFYYGFETDSKDEFGISEPKIVYSNEFTIK
jgi:hypothetical protein